MTAHQPTPQTGESVTNEQTDRGIRHVGTLFASEHDIDGCGPAGHFSTNHAGDVDAEVFVGGRVFVAAESEEVARASTGIGFTPEQARRLAGLLLRAADELDDTDSDSTER